MISSMVHWVLTCIVRPPHTIVHKINLKITMFITTTIMECIAAINITSLLMETI